MCETNVCGIKGMYYIKNYLGQEEIDLCLNKINSEIDFVPITQTPHSRKVAQFGYYYSYDRSGLKPTNPIPEYLAVLASEQRVNTICGNITNGPFDQLIINEYKPGQQIAPHTDHVTQFGPVIACITLGQQVPITFVLGLD